MRICKNYEVAVIIVDNNTQIQIAEPTVLVRAFCSERAKVFAVEQAKDTILGRVCDTWCARYGLTARQFMALFDDGRINPLEGYTFKAVYAKEQ